MCMKKRLWLVQSFILWMISSPLLASDYLIHAGQMIDSVKAKIRETVSVTVTDNKIIGIDQGFKAPKAGQTLIDLKEYTLMPGLIDTHVHISGQPAAHPTPDTYTERFRKNDTDFVLRATQYTRATLLAGFTTVRDVGGTLTLSLRDAINAGYIDGPRILAAGGVIGTTGGHGDPTNGLNRELRRLKGDPDPEEGVISGPDEARRAVRQRYKEGSNLIKIMATAGVLSLEKHAGNPQMTLAEMQAVVDTARDYELPIAAHAHGAEGILRAVEAGVDSVEHATFMTEDIMALMKKKGTYYVPTLTSGRNILVRIDTYPAVVQPKARLVGEQRPKTFAQAYKKGMKIAFGTDAGATSEHGKNASEFLYMVEGGMPPMAAIQSATLEAAKLLRRDETLGSIEPGKLADLVAVKGNPLEDVRLMTKVGFVMKDGVVYKHE